MGKNKHTVEVSGILSTETKTNDVEATMFAAHVMLKQIDAVGNGCMHWLIMSVGKMLSINPEMSLSEFYKELSEICPERYEEAMERFARHQSEEIGGDW